MRPQYTKAQGQALINENFIFLAAAFSVSGSLTYSYHVLKGRAKPNRVTFILWALIPMIAFFAQLDEGVGLESLMTFIVGFGPIIIICASFLNKDSYWQISKLDITCAGLSILAIALWLYTGSGNVAIALSILADFIAAIPTLIKSYKHPETEHTSVYRNAGINAGITLLIIDEWKFANYSFALYILAIAIILYSLIKFKIGKRLSARSELRSK